MQRHPRTNWEGWMNYRHIYHAGNFADVIKHLVLALCIDYLKRKDNPFCIIDAHGGCGLYDLSSEQAQKTGEWTHGIGRLDGLENLPADLALYLSLIQKDRAAGKYPGSPMIAGRMLRPSDRLIANELHPDDQKTLRMVMGPKKNVRVTKLDAYECIRAHIPPAERRGLVLIDPPFEQKDEFDTLIRQMKEWKKRWPTGIYLLWYPIKAHLPVAQLKESGTLLGLPDTWAIDILKYPAAQPETFNGSGLILFNAPYQLPERIGALLPLLADRMDLHDTTLQPLKTSV
jgi:23S rRNA (adenine2030-N6)-methyltransferase